ncbi:SEC-C domain-containing protein [Hymenobacter fastidiosus]|uniref:SEC-C domain-containing protein n=1 Tax=Hymenobacter fastidiosus TaxID=486264 RepID=A0ABP7SPS0_9BACT
MSEFRKNPGGTAAEQYLARLGERSFLTLWSYASPFRNQNASTQGGDGKELCDLLVVFNHHVIIFSSKHCQYPTTADPILNWSRWYKRAVAAGADQLYGAERWLKQHPNRVYLDKDCQHPFPVPLPAAANMKVHRIVVAHGASGPCQAEFGGTGSLMLDNQVVGPAHYDTQRFKPEPFTVGLVDPAKGYVHVFDDASLAAVMGMLDTITDFVEYLEKKEALLVHQGLKIWAAGEDDFVAHYLHSTDQDEDSPTFGQHFFPVSPGYEGVSIEEGYWRDFIRSPYYQSKHAADKGSYTWDELIEHLYTNTAPGKAHPLSTDTSFASREAGLRLMAQEPRLSRRMLAKAFRQMIEQSQPGQYRVKHTSATEDTGVQYLFLLLPHAEGVPEADYRAERFKALRAYCLAVKFRNFGNTRKLVGVAAEAGGFDAIKSFDLTYLDGAVWYVDEQKEAEVAHSLLFRNAVASTYHEDESPEVE